MKANEVRRAFVDFFVARDHTLVPSAKLIPHDSTLLFVNSGMVQFKPYFQGLEPAPFPRAVSVQKCVRAGGKHNDLDEVGRTTRHLTFFEMLGNFSFGDYFKEDAIRFCWELVTDGFGMDGDRMWATVHHTDDEGADIWRDAVGLPAERIQRLGDDDNWWRMADTGPNGPSSELHLDRGPELGPDGGPIVDVGGERFLEFWNLVFMQFDQQPDGTQVPLPRPSIDTGLGLERLLSLLQGVGSVWETDEFVRILDVASQVTGVTLGGDPEKDVSLKILADHARSAVMLITDGVFPSNEDRGYVLRRIMRRAIRHAYLLGVDQVVTPRIADTVIEIMGPDYPELITSRDRVLAAVESEEVRFRETLRSGSAILDGELARVDADGSLPGSVAFMLHDTYGFPLEITTEIAAERDIAVDTEEFDRAMARQRQLAKDARRTVGPVADEATFRALAAERGPTEFVGREEVRTDATVLAVVDVAADGDDDRQVVVLDRTPFYAESGGQVGDTGSISTDGAVADVLDTTYVAPELIGHHVRRREGALAPGQRVRAAIDVGRRDAIRRNHTGTHILHWALRELLGDHVIQQGSLVAPDRLRFDFSHFQPVTDTEIAAIEDLANSDILANPPVHHFETTKAHAEELGAIAFFGDKYGDIVRVLQAGEHSTELCGGTHVRALGDIGPMKIVSESSIGANLRRVEAVTGTGTIERLRQDEHVLAEAAGLLAVAPDEVADGVSRLRDEVKGLRKELDALRRQQALASVDQLAGQLEAGAVVARVDGLNRGDLRELALAVRSRPEVQVVVLGGVVPEGGVALVAAVDDESGHDASVLIADAARMVGGGGGKDPKVAMAGGREPSQLDSALELVRSRIP